MGYCKEREITKGFLCFSEGVRPYGSFAVTGHVDIEMLDPEGTTFKKTTARHIPRAIRTLIDKNSFTGKKVVIFTTTNAFEQEKYKEKSKDLVREAGGEVVGYYQVLAKEEVKEEEKIDRPIEQIVEDALKFVPEIQKVFSSSP